MQQHAPYMCPLLVADFILYPPADCVETCPTDGSACGGKGGYFSVYPAASSGPTKLDISLSFVSLTSEQNQKKNVKLLWTTIWRENL